MKITKIAKDISKIHEIGKEPHTIIINDVDYCNLFAKSKFIIKSFDKTNSIFGLDLLVIPDYLENPEFLKGNKALILDKETMEFLKEELK